MTDINVGQLAESINNKLDRDGNNAGNPCYILKTAYVNGTSGYNIWSNGYCEQWGVSTVNANTWTIISLLKTFANTTYFCLVSGNNHSTANDWASVESIQPLTTSTLRVFTGLDSSELVNWKASGYLAEGQY